MSNPHDHDEDLAEAAEPFVDDNDNVDDDYDGNDDNDNSNKWKKNGFGQGTGMRTGKYTKEESEIVKQAVEEYCAIKGVSIERLCSECEHKADVKGAWTEIAKKLPHRPVQSVYRHGLRQLHPFRRGAWTDDEVDQLMRLVTQHGKKWAFIQAKLNRSADACRDKHRECDETFVRGRWKDEELEKFQQLIRDHLKCDPNASIKELGKMVDNEGIKIPWHIISKKMENRSRLSCFKKWQKLTGLLPPSHMPGGSGGVGGSDDGSGLKNPPPPSARRTRAMKEVVRPSAGPDAALAVAAATAGIVNNPIEQAEVEDGGDPDLTLLTELVETGEESTADVSWDDMSVSSGYQRYRQILEDFQLTNPPDSVLALPLWKLAQHILDQKTSAQRAAETVEAVDLPAVPETLHVTQV